MYYVLYLDDDDYETSAFVLAPNKHIAEMLLSPHPVLEVMEVEDEDFLDELVQDEEEDIIEGEDWWDCF